MNENLDFQRLVEPHRAKLRLHCYRMLGSSFDADDMVQETFTRAFRSKQTLEDEALVRPWLYRIATNVCLSELASRPRRARGPELGPPMHPDAPPVDVTPDSEWIEPVPSAWLEGADPCTAYTVKESVALAFVAALQVLTPAQRAVLLLRDVVGLTAEETAAALESTTSAANSALHRAREALEKRIGPRAEWSPDAQPPVDRALLERYLRVWEGRDLDAIVALLHEEVTLSMPPRPMWVAGRENVVRFFHHRVGEAVAEGRYRTMLLEANGRPAIGFFRPRDDARVFFALQVLEMQASRVRRIDHFMGTSAHEAFFRTGVPRAIAP
jgi:RNA polymerase sigma-70 factor, ECF subfamily